MSAVQQIRALAAQCGFPDTEIILSDWNVTFFPADYTRDTCFMGPYILYNYFRLYPHVAGICYTSLSDINEDFFSPDLLFHGGPGLLDHYGIPKAAYLALSAAYRLDRHIVQTGENYVIAQTESGYELLLYNLDFYDGNYRSMDTSSLSYSQRYAVFEEVHALSFHTVFPVEAGKYTITRHRVNRDAGSSYDAWLKMGSPTVLSRGLVRHLRSRCVPEIYCETLTAANSLRFDETVPPHGFVYISILRQQ